ncbi:hypothetical protein EYV94_01515 [Puteibacter caeruleilacunae]|nr:hypothetical protein EYV94_01515 [Puteibacter caeruleilacunae]
MKLFGIPLILLMCCIYFACDDESPADKAPEELQFSYQFKTDMEGWTGDFADYPEGAEDFYELSLGHSMLPAPLDQSQGAIKQSGNNHSDDLFMFIKRKITGLVPNTNYSYHYTMEIATNVADGSIGVGGSPGESVYIKVGATTKEPKKVLNDDDFYLMNIDKSNQSNSGKDMTMIDNFANGTDQNIYKLKNVTSIILSTILQVTSNDKGEVWLVVGTDSGFESTTTIYYNKITVSMSPFNIGN